MTGKRRALLASAAVMDAAGWMCAAQGAYGLARVCFSAAIPFIVAWVLSSPCDWRRARPRRATGSVPPPFRGARGATGPDPLLPAHMVPPPTWRGGGTAPFGGGAPSGCIYRCGPPARDWLNE